MLKCRVIPILTFNGFALVKSKEFGSNARMVGNAIQAAKVYNLSRNEKSNEQISIEMGISKRTVENHLYSGLKKLKEAMSKYFESED